MAKLHKTLPPVEYCVAWSQARGRFNIFRNGDRTSYFSGRQAVAIGLAVQDAKREAARTGQMIVVTSMRNDRRIMEWNAWPIRARWANP
jgi:hypothetical protein